MTGITGAAGATGAIGDAPRGGGGASDGPNAIPFGPGVGVTDSPRSEKYERKKKVFNQLINWSTI